jgi:hypothetical protein
MERYRMSSTLQLMMIFINRFSSYIFIPESSPIVEVAFIPCVIYVTLFRPLQIGKVTKSLL